MKLTIAFSILLALIVAGVAVWWGATFTQALAVNIQGSHDAPENGLPVYAQFVVTQEVTVPAIEASSITLPVYFTAAAAMNIDLLQDDNLLYSWWYTPQRVGSVETARLAIIPPQALEGKLQVRLRAQRVSVADKEQAPRIFIETAGDYYPDGQYQIADNVKTGDVVLSITERVPQWESLRRQLSSKLAITAQAISRWLLFCLLLITSPFVIRRIVLAHAYSGTQADDEADAHHAQRTS